MLQVLLHVGVLVWSPYILSRAPTVTIAEGVVYDLEFSLNTQAFVYMYVSPLLLSNKSGVGSI